MNYGRRKRRELHRDYRHVQAGKRGDHHPSEEYMEKETRKQKQKKIYSFKKNLLVFFCPCSLSFFVVFWLSWERKRISWTPSLTHRKRGRRSRGSETPAPTAKKKRQRKEERGRKRGECRTQNKSLQKKTFEKKNSKQQIKYELLQETKLSDSQLQKLNACYKITAVLLLTNLRLKG